MWVSSKWLIRLSCMRFFKIRMGWFGKQNSIMRWFCQKILCYLLITILWLNWIKVSVALKIATSVIRVLGGWSPWPWSFIKSSFIRTHSLKRWILFSSLICRHWLILRWISNEFFSHLLSFSQLIQCSSFFLL